MQRVRYTDIDTPRQGIQELQYIDGSVSACSKYFEKTLELL